MDSLVSKLILVLLMFSSLMCGAEATQQNVLSVQDMVERINQRYDDFFRYHRGMEERAKRFEHGRGERKAAEKAHYDSLERARQRYVETKKPRNSDEPLRIQWEKEEKERKEKFEMYRQRHVRTRDEVERYLLKGRKIPELKEYDLEGY
jgi:cupin superfamily acireductone dioxygenase involved in methionine salvage